LAISAKSVFFTLIKIVFVKQIEMVSIGKNKAELLIGVKTETQPVAEN
jgi:hypothetical protein